MSDLLSQAEIDALLSGANFGEATPKEDFVDQEVELNAQEIDAIGEIGNISMGTASTALFTLLGQKVLITTPNVTILTWGELASNKVGSYVAVKTEFTHGLTGTNLLILKEEDVKIITDLMMGGDGSNVDGPITDLHLSAIGEAMNQMFGSAATSMASMINKRIEITPPKAFKTNLSKDDFSDFNQSEKLVKVSFKMEIGSLINSEIMQLQPLKFAKEMVSGLLNVEEEAEPSGTVSSQDYENEQNYGYESVQQTAAAVPQAAPEVFQQQVLPPQQPQVSSAPSPEPPPAQFAGNYMPPQQQQPPQMSGHNPVHLNNSGHQSPVNIQPVQFQSFDEGRNPAHKENIGLLLDVPLQVTVELGRTQRLIRDILEFAPGSIIELDKLAGEQVDILVNGKIIAKGEVVIIDESFGVRVTDIVQPSKRL